MVTKIRLTVTLPVFFFLGFYLLVCIMQADGVLCQVETDVLCAVI